MNRFELLNQAREVITNQKKGGDEEFIKLMVRGEFVDNYYGEGIIQIGNTDLVIESLWFDGSEGEIYIHGGNKEFEGDLKLTSLSTENQIAVIDMLTKSCVYELHEVYRCSHNAPSLAYVKIKWNDCDEVEKDIQAIVLEDAGVGHNDDDILYYCSNIDALCELFKPCNSSDFQIVDLISFEE